MIFPRSAIYVYIYTYMYKRVALLEFLFVRVACIAFSYILHFERPFARELFSKQSLFALRSRLRCWDIIITPGARTRERERERYSTASGYLGKQCQWP